MNNVTEIEMNADLTIATVDGVDYKVTDIHSWDDFGRTQETATLEGYGEIYCGNVDRSWR
jgi:hypothetical protein